ncbi:MAG: spermidine synthase [Myxococcota bacterium]
MVTGVFMAGLGLGAWAGGAWADRRQTGALRAYGLVELAVAGWGMALAVLLPGVSLEASWQVGEAGWLWPADLGRRIGLAIALLGPPAALMGATVSLLSRRVLAGHVGSTGWRMGVLMGANTAGAATGALACDLWLVPAVGVFGTQGVAAGIGLLAGIGALLLPDAPAEPSPAVGQAPSRYALSLALGGVAAMGLEVVWFRFIASALGSFRAALSMTLAVVLVGLWLGALLAGLLERTTRRPALLLAGGQVATAVLALAAFVLFSPDDVLSAQLSLPPLPANLSTAARLVLPAAIAMGMAFPLAAAAVQGPESHLGRRTGALFAAGSAGNLLGALGTGFVLLPILGMQGALLVLACSAIAAAAVAVPPHRWWILVPGGVAVMLFSGLPDGRILAASFPAGRLAMEGVLAVSEGAEQTIVVTGAPQGPARLWTGGHPMSSTTPHAQRYMRFMAHMPLLLHPDPTRALVICFGVGNTTHAVSLHPSMAAIDVADLSPEVLRHASWFSHANRDVLDDPRVQVFVDDGRRVLASAGPDYDLITLEPPPIAYAGVSALYSRELYEQAEARLSDGGFLSQWVPGYQVPAPAVLALVRAFVEVFPDAVLFVADRRELVLVGRKGGMGSVDLAELQQRIDGRPEVAADLEAIALPDAVALTGRFALTGLLDVTAGVAPITDDNPVLEYAQDSQVTQTRLPPSLFDVTGIGAWCPECAVPEADYGAESFLRFSNMPE